MAFEFKWKWRRIQAGHYVVTNHALIERGAAGCYWWWTVLGVNARCGRTESLAKAKREAEVAYRAGSKAAFYAWSDEEAKQEAKEEAVKKAADKKDLFASVAIAYADTKCLHCKKFIRKDERCVWIECEGSYHTDCALERIKKGKAG